jgi:hypothetical protein
MLIRLVTGPVISGELGVEAAGSAHVPDTHSNRVAELPWSARYP